MYVVLFLHPSRGDVPEQMTGETQMATREDYEALNAELVAIEERTGLYLADMCIDRENVDTDENDASYWEAMMSTARLSAGMRAEEAGQDINKLIGRVIY